MTQYFKKSTYIILALLLPLGPVAAEPIPFLAESIAGDFRGSKEDPEGDVPPRGSICFMTMGSNSQRRGSSSNRCSGSQVICLGGDFRKMSVAQGKTATLTACVKQAKFSWGLTPDFEGYYCKLILGDKVYHDGAIERNGQAGSDTLAAYSGLSGVLSCTYEGLSNIELSLNWK